MRRGIAVIFAIAVVMALPQAALSAQGSIYISHAVPLVVNEALPGFVLPQPTITIPQGTAKFITLVPKSATGRHGIGINGGPYFNIKGADVAPGASSSLTVGLPPGDYTVFDSYKQNRAAGYRVKVHVTHAKAKHVSYGKFCSAGNFLDSSQTWVKNVSCKSAGKLSESIQEKWEDAEYSYAPIVERGFTCYVTPFSAIGLKFSCLAGDSRVTYAG